MHKLVAAVNIVPNGSGNRRVRLKRPSTYSGFFYLFLPGDVSPVHRHKRLTSEVPENERSLTMFEFDCPGAEALGGKRIDESAASYRQSAADSRLRKEVRETRTSQEARKLA
ncbi:hypothetical protein IFR05_008007 [Cadophora sp. M221]|nr:hypothetical protein IFR05_008007 [Cadophora sp. M221]